VITLRGDMITLIGNVSVLRSDVNTMRRGVSAMRGDVITLIGAVTTLSGNLSALRSDVNTVRSDMSTMRSDVDTLREVIALRSNIPALRSDMPALRSDTATLRTNLRSVMPALRSGIPALGDIVHTLGNYVGHLGISLDSLIAQASEKASAQVLPRVRRELELCADHTILRLVASNHSTATGQCTAVPMPLELLASTGFPFAYSSRFFLTSAHCFFGDKNAWQQVGSVASILYNNRLYACRLESPFKRYETGHVMDLALVTCT
jgi:outer membrane murein-binding lipoprotein Lpp